MSRSPSMPGIRIIPRYQRPLTAQRKEPTMKRFLLASTALVAGSQAHHVTGATVNLSPPRQMEVRLTTETYAFAQDTGGTTLLSDAMKLSQCTREGAMNNRWRSELTITRISPERQMIYVQTPYTEYWDGLCSGRPTRVNLTLHSGWNEIRHQRSGLVNVVTAHRTQ